MRKSKHFPSQLAMRTKKTWSEMSILPHTIVKAGEKTKHKIVKNKQKKYPHQDFLVFEEENVFIGYDPTTNLLCTCMYLDGSWGYPNREYNKKEHYGCKD